MTRVRSFAPVADARAEVLILGSMPGPKSLAAAQYYAHPRNAFWPIMAELLGFAADAPYPQRLAALQAARFALWDVLQSCVRPGALDADIEPETQVANDFAGLLRRCPAIRRVYFNGATAETSFQRLVLPTLPAVDLRYARLPSTSPAHAGMTLAAKRDAWRVVLAK